MPFDEAEKLHMSLGFSEGRQAKKEALDAALKKVPTMNSRKTSFTLGPFSQRESSGVVKAKSTFKVYSNGVQMTMEVTAQVRWDGPLDRDDEQRITTQYPEYFVKRIA
jgi:hypothetical protein